MQMDRTKYKMFSVILPIDEYETVLGFSQEDGERSLASWVRMAVFKEIARVKKKRKQPAEVAV